MQNLEDLMSMFAHIYHDDMLEVKMSSILRTKPPVS
jgi:hypothetical protein